MQQKLNPLLQVIGTGGGCVDFSRPKNFLTHHFSRQKSPCSLFSFNQKSNAPSYFLLSKKSLYSTFFYCFLLSFKKKMCPILFSLKSTFLFIFSAKKDLAQSFSFTRKVIAPSSSQPTTIPTNIASSLTTTISSVRNVTGRKNCGDYLS